MNHTGPTTVQLPLLFNTKQLLPERDGLFGLEGTGTEINLYKTILLCYYHEMRREDDEVLRLISTHIASAVFHAISGKVLLLLLLLLLFEWCCWYLCFLNPIWSGCIPRECAKLPQTKLYCAGEFNEVSADQIRVLIFLVQSFNLFLINL